jgi:transcriptional activator of cad operon
MKSPDSHNAIRIGAWRVDPALDEISKDGNTVKLEPRTMQLLVCLAEHAGQVLSVEQLLDQVWRDVVVTPNSLYHAVAELRRVLGDDPKEPTYIVNVLRRGYRLVAPVAPWIDAPAVPESDQRAAPEQASALTETAAPPATATSRSPLRRYGITLIVALAFLLVLAYLAADKFWLSKPATAEHSATATSTAAPYKSIAVLPFVNMSEDKNNEYFSDGLSEELIDLLTKVPDLQVPASTSSFYFKGKQTTVAEIARALNVSHVLEGSVRKSGNKLRITAQLIRVDNGYHLWSETYDRELDDIFKIQDEIANAVVKALKVSLLGSETPRSTPTTNTEAYTLYLQARSIALRASQADYEAANEYLRQALKLDPKFAAAWAALANDLVDEFNWNKVGRVEDIRDEAQRAAAEAIRLDPNLSDGHLAMAKILYLIDWNWDAAEVEFKTTLALDPASGDALRWKAYLAFTLHRCDQFMALAQSALARDPLNAWNYYAIGAAYDCGGRFTEAEAAFRKALELNPTGAGIHSELGFAMLARGEPAEALAEIEREKDDLFRDSYRPSALDAMGRKSEADRDIAVVEGKYGAKAPGMIAPFYVCREDWGQALIWLDRAYRQRDTWLLWEFPCRKQISRDPRYKAFRHRMNLPE